MRYDPRLGRNESLEERCPSPNPAELAKMCGYASVEEMEKACAMESINEDAPDLTDEYEDQAKWFKDHPFSCELCKEFITEIPDNFYDQGSGPECNGPNPNVCFLKAFPFDNGCKHHSKRRAGSETTR